MLTIFSAAVDCHFGFVISMLNAVGLVLSCF